MLNIIKNHPKISAFVLVAVALLLSMVFINNKKQESTTPTISPVYPQAKWDSLTPGISSREEINQKLGSPTSEKTEGDKTIASYKSKSATRPNVVTYQNQTGIFFKEIVTTKDSQRTGDIIKIYKEAKYILYGPDAPNGDYLFVYPENGIAYLGNPNTGTLLEIWYFTPTTFEDFKSKWASDYSSTLPRVF